MMEQDTKNTIKLCGYVGAFFALFPIGSFMLRTNRDINKCKRIIQKLQDTNLIKAKTTFDAEKQYIVKKIVTVHETTESSYFGLGCGINSVGVMSATEEKSIVRLPGQTSYKFINELVLGNTQTLMVASDADVEVDYDITCNMGQIGSTFQRVSTLYSIEKPFTVMYRRFPDQIVVSLIHQGHDPEVYYPELIEWKRRKLLGVSCACGLLSFLLLSGVF